MHFHYYTLQHLSKALTLGEMLTACFSQSKNELVMAFHTFYLRIGCNTPLTYVVPTRQFARARKNVVDLFESLVGKTLIETEVIAYERVLKLIFEDHYELILKLHGPQANVIAIHHKKVCELFNNQLTADWDYEDQSGYYHPEALQAQPELSHTAVLQALRKVSPIYEKQFAAKVLAGMQDGVSFEKAYNQVIAIVKQPVFYLDREDRKIKFYLFEPAQPHQVVSIQGVEHALQLFLRSHFQYDRYVRQYKKLHKTIHTAYKKVKKTYDSYQRNIHQLETERNPEEIGHLILANLHEISAGQQKVTLPDYYQGGTLTIKLKPELSPQDNAQQYYEKYKQRKTRLKYLKGQQEEIAQKFETATQEWEAFLKVPTPQDLIFDKKGFDPEEIQLLKQFNKTQSADQKEATHPFRTFEREGYQIFVGRNAKNNDELSFKFASKEDLWLHAKDVSGSHVVIRQKPGKPLPTPVLEYAASLAAYYSKRKTDTLVPVIYTPRKYIRKRKGDPPGSVVVSREDVIMVEPIRD